MLGMDFQRQALEEAPRPLGPCSKSGTRLLSSWRSAEAGYSCSGSSTALLGEALGLGERWLNTGPSSLMDFGWPEGWEGRLTTRQYGGLCLHLPSREDQTCFKLYAAVDRGPNDKHYEDLKTLEPTQEELLFAARWTVTHDPSEGFRGEIVQCLADLGVEVLHDDLQ
jgi:hypothetical protein